MLMETTVSAAGARAAADGMVVGERAVDDLSLGLVPQKVARTAAYAFQMMNPVPSTDPTVWDSSSECSRLFGDLYYDFAAARTLQPFPAPHFRNPGVASTRYPFTWAQWQELERQALIYKHMVASVPVPPELVISIANSSSSSCSRTALPDVSASHLRGCGSFNYLRFCNGTDPEPGRCRRTDGKKWRCSRDAAPDQKYCERHMHRGRPRSRKPVEVAAAQDLTRPTTTDTDAAAISKAFHRTPALPSQAMVPKEGPRCLDPVAAAITGSNGSLNSLVLQPYEDHLSLSSVDFGNGFSKTDQENDGSCLYLKNDFTDPYTEQTQSERSFIDAWSATSGENRTVPPNTNESLISSLTLSIPGEKMDQTQMGSGDGDSKRDSSWINPIPWLSSPLGEVLQQSGSNSASPPRGCSASPKGSWGGDGSNPLERAPSRLSSPSSVRHRTLAPLSDSSGISSPISAAAAKSEIALQLLMPLP